MKKRKKIKSERLNVIRSIRRTDKAFLERIIEDRLLDVYQAFQESQNRMVWALIDKLDALESLQMDLVKIQSGLTQKICPDYVPAVREQASRGYHELHLN